MATLNTSNHITGEENSWPERPWGEDAGEDHVSPVRVFAGDGDPTCVFRYVWGGVSLHGCLPLRVHLGPVLLPGLARVRSGATPCLLSFHGRRKPGIISFFFHTAPGLE